MAIIVNKVVALSGHEPIFDGNCGFVSKRQLKERARELKAAKKHLILPGLKRAIETAHFFNNARSFSRIAKEKATELNRPVVAILFRDCDGTGSSERGDWETKRQSMLNGFEAESFHKGVPMIPNPKSEAWLICAFKKQPYQHCDALEGSKGNNKSQNPLKKQLEALIGKVTSAKLCERVEDDFDVRKIMMPSFRAFRSRLEEVL